MKVLYLTNPLRCGTGGDRRSFEVLRRISSQGIEPVIVVDEFVYRKMKQDGNLQLSAKQKIYSLKRPNVIYNQLFKTFSRAALDYYSIAKTAKQIAQIAKQEKVDLIVSHHEKIDFLLEAYHAAKQCTLPWTCIFQSFLFPPYASMPWRRLNASRKAYLFALYGPLYAQVLKAMQSTTMLAVSSSIEVDMKRYFSGWRGRMIVLHPGVAVQNQRIQAAEPSKERVDAVFFSRLVPEKGIYDLPEIATLLVNEKTDLRFLVLGKFDSLGMKANYENLVKNHNLSKNLVYGGYLEGEALFSVVKAAKVMVYPSLHDAFPLVVLESLAAGTPVVAYDVPAIRLNFPADLVRTVPVGDYKLMAIEAQKIIADKHLREALSQKALAFASDFSWNHVVEAERKAYDDVLGVKLH
ncbi:MAG: glycosyltransferase family 4 protein [Candidatus Bathyarchaeota archaeon]|nr:glycosyltransferase family 4 protein [Candidatus Bathyarchaeota archaeon]